MELISYINIWQEDTANSKCEWLARILKGALS
jgi:hypothetical protein